MDETTVARIKAWIEAKSHGNGCSWCGGHDFEVRGQVEFKETHASDMLELTAIQCTGCNQTFLFDTRVL